MKKYKILHSKNIARESDARVAILGSICALLTVILTVGLIFADAELRALEGTRETELQSVEREVEKHLASVSKKLRLASKCYGEQTFRRSLTDVLLLCERIRCTLEIYQNESSPLAQYCEKLSEKVYALSGSADDHSRQVCAALEAVNSSLERSGLDDNSVQEHILMLEGAESSE